MTMPGPGYTLPPMPGTKKIPPKQPAARPGAAPAMLPGLAYISKTAHAGPNIPNF